MTQPIGLALVGCGGISRAHVRGYQDLFERGCREFEITACCDVDLERAELRAAEISVFQGRKPAVLRDVEALAASGMAQAADLCLPHCFHHTVAEALLASGMHVMIEKPLGISVRASKRIIEAARAAGCILATGENIRRGLSARACAWALTTARLVGDLRMVNVQLISHSPFDYTRPAAKWRGIKRLTGGGMIMDSGAHLADMVQVLFGPVDEVWCTMQTLDTRTIEDAPVIGSAPADVEDTWHAVIRFASGLHLTWTYSRSLYGPDVRLGNYYGSAGMMQDLGFVFHPFQGGGEAHLADGSTLAKEDIEQAYLQSLSDGERERLFPYGATDGFAIEVWDFVHAIATDGRPEMDGLDGLRAKVLCEACYESAVAGRAVRYADVLASRIDAYQAPIDVFWGID
jgi:predicted dehydrogenase